LNNNCCIFAKNFFAKKLEIKKQETTNKRNKSAKICFIFVIKIFEFQKTLNTLFHEKIF